MLRQLALAVPLFALACARNGAAGDADGDDGGSGETADTQGSSDSASASNPDDSGSLDSGPTEGGSDDGSDSAGDTTGEPVCEATQFGDTPQAWSLPELGFPIAEQQPMVLLADNWGCTNEQTFRYSTLDLTGDGVLDLVVTDACDSGDVGATSWLVYAGGSDGFADEPSLWSLPDHGFPVAEPQPFVVLADNWGCSNEQTFRYSTFDLTGDGILDLVVTDACDSGDVGATSWLVYAGGSDGFADEPSLWSLPDHGFPVVEPQPFVVLADNWGCSNEQTFRYSTLDLTGDGVLDLVVTDACDSGDVGATSWLVYAGGSDGFADEPALWSLPDHGFPVVEPQPFVVLADNWGCRNEQTFRYSTLDLTGDGVLDLVVTDACDSGDVGATSWLVYAGGSGGFADEPALWSLPDHGFPVAEPQPFVVLADNWGCTNEQTFRYSILDLNGEHHPDLVVTDACDAADVGATLWISYPGECA